MPTDPDSPPATLAPGGWCTPEDQVYDTGPNYADLFTFPEVRVTRGGIHYPRPGTPEWEAQQRLARTQEVVAAFIHRAVGDVHAAQEAAIGVAHAHAMAYSMGVRIQRPPWSARVQGTGAMLYRFIGLELDPTARPFAIYEHDAEDTRWDTDDDD